MRLKTKIWSKGAHLSKSRLERKRGEKGEKMLGLGKYQVIGGISSHFLLLRDQETYKKRLKRFKVRNQTLTSLFVILILGKSHNLRERGFY